MNLIKNDIGDNVATPKLQVIAKVSKWDKYEFFERNGIKFIRGFSLTPNAKLFEFEKITTPGVLFSIVELANKLHVKNAHMQKYISDNLTDNDIELILKFCRSYGLPFWCWNSFTSTVNFCINVQLQNNDIARDTIMHPIVPFATENYFHIASFVQAVYRIKSDFLRLVAWNHWENDINIQPLLSKDDITHLTVLRSLFQHGICLFSPSLKPFVTYWDDEKMCLALNCENIFHLSVYYLCVLQQSRSFFGGYVCKCKMCGNFFVTSQSRKKYCGNPCTRQSAYNQRMRNRL